MAWIVGILLALAVSIFARLVGFDREKGFYPFVLIIVGSLYVLFATMAGNGSEIFVEAIIGAAFVALAAIGFRTSLWFVVAGLALHGIFDFVRGGILPGTGVPGFWPAFCGSYDVVAAAILAALMLLDQRRIARA